MTRRPQTLVRLSLLAALGASLLALVPPASGQPAAWTVPTGPVTVTYWDGVENVKNELMSKKLIPEYQKLHPNVTIKYETISGLSYKLSVALATGTAATIFTLPDFLLPAAVEVNALDPLPPAAWGQGSVAGVLDTYLPRLLDFNVEGGKLYAIPDQMNAHSLYINNRMFREAGLDPAKDAPKTWDEVAKLNAVLTKRQADRIVQKGWDMRYAGEHWLTRMFLILLYQAGGEAIRDGKPAFNGEAGIQALSVWKSVTVAPKVSQNTLASPYQDFAMEQDAMTFAGPNAGASIEKINPKIAGNYTCAPLPAIRADRPATIVYSYNWAVNAKAAEEQRKAAWDFIHYASGRPAEWMAVAKYLQPVKGWFETPAARQTPFLSVFIHDLSVGRPMPRTKYYTELQASLARMIERVVFNNADPKQALDQAAEEYTRASKG
jgi:multiple sugar transport system substrate-binding protein